MNLILKAARYAELHHRFQFRKYTLRPYITHPARVAARLSYHSLGTPTLLAAAYAHDLIEDTPVTFLELAHELGPEVAELVQEVTNPSKQFPELLRAERKAMDLRHIERISKEGKILKLVDRNDNLNELPLDDAKARKFLKDVYLQESKDLFEAVKDADEELAKELFNTICFLETNINDCNSGRYQCKSSCQK